MAGRHGLIAGQGVSQLAYPLLLLAITRSLLAAGVVLVTRALPYVVLGLPAGALVDRWNRRHVMIICDLVRSVNLFTIPVALIWAALGPAQLYVTSFVGGTPTCSSTPLTGPVCRTWCRKSS